MNFLRLLVLASFLTLVACSSDAAASADGDAATTTTPNYSNVETIDPADIERPTGCTVLTDEQVLEALAPEAESEIFAQAGSSVSACYYRIDNRYWNADLIVEVADGSRADAIIREVKMANDSLRIQVNGKNGIMKNDNRILTVNAGPPYEIKLSVLPKEGYKEIKTSENRREIILKLAKMLEDKI